MSARRPAQPAPPTTFDLESGEGHPYAVEGRFLFWPVIDEDAPVVTSKSAKSVAPVFVVRIPLRLKLGLLRSFTADIGEGTEANQAMFDLIEKIAPGQADAIDEMDVNDFQDMFSTWQDVYSERVGLTPGESERSSS